MVEVGSSWIMVCSMLYIWTMAIANITRPIGKKMAKKPSTGSYSASDYEESVDSGLKALIMQQVTGGENPHEIFNLPHPTKSLQTFI